MMEMAADHTDRKAIRSHIQNELTVFAALQKLSKTYENAFDVTIMLNVSKALKPDAPYRESALVHLFDELLHDYCRAGARFIQAGLYEREGLIELQMDSRWNGYERRAATVDDVTRMIGLCGGKLLFDNADGSLHAIRWQLPGRLLD